MAWSDEGQLCQLLQEGHTSGGDPLDDVNIALGIEAGIMRMDELAVLPAFRLFTHCEAVENLLGPFRIVSEMDDDVVVLIEN
jgi:hypothetical protein